MRFSNIIILLSSIISLSFYSKNDSDNISHSRVSISNDTLEIPSDGIYRYDIAFAEWDGKSLGEKVTVIIKGDSVKVIYEGDGQLTLTKPGEIIDEGILRKHKTGQWIISSSEEDTEANEIGGCTNGPSVIDFKNKKYWMC